MLAEALQGSPATLSEVGKQSENTKQIQNTACVPLSSESTAGRHRGMYQDVQALAGFRAAKRSSSVSVENSGDAMPEPGKAVQFARFADPRESGRVARAQAG